MKSVTDINIYKLVEEIALKLLKLPQVDQM